MQIIKALSSADTHLSKFTERYVVNSDKEFISGVVEVVGSQNLLQCLFTHGEVAIANGFYFHLRQHTRTTLLFRPINAKYIKKQVCIVKYAHMFRWIYIIFR